MFIDYKLFRNFISLILLSVACSCDYDANHFEENNTSLLDKSFCEGHNIVSAYQLKSGKYFLEAGYEIISGKEYFDSNLVSVRMEKSAESILLTVEVDFGDSMHYPELYNGAHDMTETANELRVDFVCRNDAKKSIHTSWSISRPDYGKATFSFRLVPMHLKSLAVGRHNLHFEIVSEFITFLGAKSGVKPFHLVLSAPVDIAPILKSTLYFKSLKMNESETNTELGGSGFMNDFRNSSPEIELDIFYDNYFVLEKFRRNGYEISGSGKADFYRTNRNQNFGIEIYDLDYFLNGSDYITDTLINISDLEGDTYKKFSFYCVEELWIYCKTGGQVN